MHPDAPAYPVHRTDVETVSGLYLDYLDPKPEDIAIEDIAAGLANACRFGGQTRPFLSVAQHALIVQSLVDLPLRLAALHHDSHEAYMLDWPAPLKKAIGYEHFERVARPIDAAIGERFGIDPELFRHPDIKAADIEAMRMEAAVVKRSRGLGEHWGYDALPDRCVERVFDRPEAERAFLTAHHYLMENG